MGNRGRQRVRKAGRYAVQITKSWRATPRCSWLISNSASLSMENAKPVELVSWCSESIVLYGYPAPISTKARSPHMRDYEWSRGRTSTTISETLGEGMMLDVASILSGSSSRSLFSRNVPRPLPVPPPSEYMYPWSESHFSACLRV